ncbi:MAG: hypothetical protein H0X62_10715 [Bacteroidetes bacterium]|nr:hypothetical protein [Bacteroidota bacterium]
MRKEKNLKQIEKIPESVVVLKEPQDSLSNVISENSGILKDLKVKQELSIDTNLLAHVADSAFNHITYEEQIVVKKDELLSSKIINLINLTHNQDPAKLKKDSLAQISSGIKEIEPVSAVTVEFWKSPINYRGYKMSRNKLIVFGLQETGNAKLFLINDLLYLKNFDKVYKIQKSTDFRSLEVTTEPEILNSLIN